MKKILIIAALLLPGLALAQSLPVYKPVQGGTGTGVVPTTGQLLYSPAGGTYTPTTLSSLGLATFAYPFPLAATSTLLTFSGGLLSGASTTVNGAFTVVGAAALNSTLNVLGATTLSSTLSVTGLSTLTGGFLSAASSTVNGNFFVTPLGTPAGSFLAVDPSGKLIATTTPSFVGVAAVTGTYPVVSSGGTTPAISLAFGTTTSNTWAGLQNFSLASTSQFTSTSTTYLASTGGNVGIGATSTPSSILSIQGVANFVANTISTMYSGLRVLVSLIIPFASNPAPTATGQIAQSTNAPYQIQMGNNVAGTTVFDPRISLIIGSPATTTAWTGSSTAPAIIIPTGITWSQIQCTSQPPGSTLDAQYQYANPSSYTNVFSTMLVASATPGVYTLSSNNTPNANASTTITFGTPTGSPISASCTLTGTVNGI